MLIKHYKIVKAMLIICLGVIVGEAFMHFINIFRGIDKPISSLAITAFALTVVIFIGISMDDIVEIKKEIKTLKDDKSHEEV